MTGLPHGACCTQLMPPLGLQATTQYQHLSLPQAVLSPGACAWIGPGALLQVGATASCQGRASVVTEQLACFLIRLLLSHQTSCCRASDHLA